MPATNAYEESLQVITLEAGADLSAKQYRGVVIAADGQVDAVSAAGGDADGILQNKPSAAGDDARIAIGGVSYMQAGTGGITRGQKVQCDGNGDGILAASGDHVIGKALTTAAVGELFSILLVSKHILA